MKIVRSLGLREGIISAFKATVTGDQTMRSSGRQKPHAAAAQDVHQGMRSRTRSPALVIKVPNSESWGGDMAKSVPGASTMS